MHVLTVKLELAGLRVLGVVALGIVNDLDALLRPKQCPGFARLLIPLTKLGAFDVPPCNGPPADAAGLGCRSERGAGRDEAADPPSELRCEPAWSTHRPLRFRGSFRPWLIGAWHGEIIREKGVK